MTYQALLGDRTFDLDLEAGTLTVDGQPVEHAFTRVAPDVYHLLLDGRSYTFTVERTEDGTLRLTHAGRALDVRLKTERDLLLERLGLSSEADAGARELHAPMPGLVVSVLVEPGQVVEAGAGLIVLEAMKMENELKAPASGTVAAVHVSPGNAVGKNELLISFEA